MFTARDSSALFEVSVDRGTCQRLKHLVECMGFRPCISCQASPRMISGSYKAPLQDCLPHGVQLSPLSLPSPPSHPRASPAAWRSCRLLLRAMPLLVRPIWGCPGRACSLCTRGTRSLRSVGSPPVSRILSTPAPTNRAAWGRCSEGFSRVSEPRHDQQVCQQRGRGPVGKGRLWARE